MRQVRVSESGFIPRLSNAELSRRQILKAAAGGALALGGGSLLAACGKSSGGASAGSDSGVATVGLQFVFIKNVQFAGSYFADSKGYYAAEGLKVNLIPGGPNLTVDPVVQSGRALVGINHTAQSVTAILNGADEVIIGAGFQRNPFTLISRAVKPIKTPSELAGKTIGVQLSDQPVFSAFLKANNIDEKSFKTVALQSDPTPLVNGELDGIMGFYSNEPNFLRIKGVEPYTLRLDEFHYPLMEEVYIAKGSSLKDSKKRKQIVGLLKAESKGWTDALADVDAAADLAVNNYGKDLKLDLQQQKLAMKSEVDLVTSDDTKQHGLFWMTDDLIAGTVASLKLGGVEASTDMFSREILEEVYQGKATV